MSSDGNKTPATPDDEYRFTVAPYLFQEFFCGKISAPDVILVGLYRLFPVFPQKRPVLHNGL
jgi:hypothetical protein